MSNVFVSLRRSGKSIVFGLVAIASSLAASAQTLPVTSAGYTPGTFDVSPTGQATYSIALWTPPGTNGVEPKLSLAYSSNNRASGWISPGWALSGLSQITRCQKTVESDGAVTPVFLATDDAYCLDGQRLESYSGVYGQPGSTYRLRIEQFSLVTAKETAGNGPAWFEVITKDGLIYEYGRTGNSRAVLPGGTTPYLWSLSKIRDRQGNNLIVDYTASSGALSPATIQYTQSPAIGASYPYTIVFGYVSRDTDDTLTGYIVGSQFNINRRLTSVDVRYGGATGTLLRQYRLSYTDSPTTQHSRLAFVQECGGSAGTDCLAATTISYQNGQSGIAAPVSAVGSLPVYNELRVADINDDGRSDLIYSTTANAGYYSWFVMLAGSSGFSAPIDTGIRIGIGDMRAELLVGDFLGVGRVQLVAPNADGLWCAWYWNEDEGFPQGGICSNAEVDSATIGGTSPGNEDAPSYASADVNADGRADLIYASTAGLGGLPTVFVRLSISVNQTLGFALPTPFYPIPDSFAGLYGSYGPATFGTATDRLDFNGDTREDVVLVTGKSNQILVQFTARELIASNGAFSTGPTLNDYFGGPEAVNWNDDACTDLQFGSNVYLAACSGSFGQSISAPQGGLRLDWNGDGRTDVLYPSGSIWAVRLSQGAQASSELSTGIPYVANMGLLPLDYDADGLIDLMSLNSSTRATAIGLHLGAGTPADLVSSIVDGHGNRFSPTYKPITQNNSALFGQAAVYPRIARLTPMYVVDQFSATDGTGGTYTNQFQYTGARWHAQGLGFLGFESKRTFDSRTGLYRTEVYSQDFPTVGWVKNEYVQQADNKFVRSTTNTLAFSTHFMNEDVPISQWRYSYFPYVRRSVTQSYELGGLRNGALISTHDVTNSYDNYGTLISQTDKTTEGATGLFSAAEYTQIVSASDVQNDEVSWCLNKPRRVQHTRRHSLPTGGDVTRTISYNWDLTNCRLTQQAVEPDSSRWGVTSDYRYDAVGNVDQVTMTPASGQLARTYAIYWGTNGRFPRTFTNPKSQVTNFGWDEVKGVRTSVTGPNNLTTTTGYDNFNRVNREVRPDGTATDISRQPCSATFVYCASADMRVYVQVVVRDTANNAIRTDIQSFDGMDRPRYRLGNLLTGAMRGEITTYNSLGLISSESAPFIQGDTLVWYTTINYDALGRPSTVQRRVSEENSSTHLTQFRYEGLSTVQVDALNRSTTRWVNAVGDIVRMVDAANGATNYEYDAFGNLVKVRDPAGNESSMTYNVRGMKETSNDLDSGAWSFDYYPLGELKSQTDAKNQTTTFTYDPLSRLLTRVDLDGTTQYTYDTAANGIGQRATSSSPGGYSETYSYDTRGRLSQTRITADSSTYQYDYSYSSTTGMLEYMTYPTSSSGFRFKLRYDYQYGLMQKVSNYTGDVLGEAYWEGIATNARGQYIDEQYGNGLRSISTYDRIAGWLDNRTTGRSGGTSLQNFAYDWDAIGNLEERRDTYNNVTDHFSYDTLDRLFRSTRNGTINLDVGYDAIGNVTSKSGVGSYTYHATKRHAVVSTTGTINNSYSYDANGNIETRNGQPITWYRNNLPKKISASSTLSNEFWYGPNGGRWKQVMTNGSSVGTWTYLGGRMDRLVTSTVNEFRHYIFGPHGVVAVYKRSASGTTPSTTYVTTDHLGSLDVISNTAGIEVADAGFTAFGERAHYTGSGPPTSGDLTSLRGVTRRGFTFHEHLDEVGLIHMNGRVYDPVIARFISPDPFVQDPFNSQSLNRYSYVLNNPLRYTDPTGYFGWDSIGNFFNGIGRAVGIIRLWREFWRTPPSCTGTLCGMTLPRDGGSGEYSGGVWSPRIIPGSPSPPQVTYARPANPVLPPADAAVPGIGQPADAVTTARTTVGASATLVLRTTSGITLENVLGGISATVGAWVTGPFLALWPSSIGEEWPDGYPEELRRPVYSEGNTDAAPPTPTEGSADAGAQSPNPAQSTRERGLPPEGISPPCDGPCEVGPASRESERKKGGKSLWDTKGGEWRWSPEDKYHNPHWDYNPHSHPSSPWENIPHADLPTHK